MLFHVIFFLLASQMDTAFESTGEFSLASTTGVDLCLDDNLVGLYNIECPRFFFILVIRSVCTPMCPSILSSSSSLLSILQPRNTHKHTVGSSTLAHSCMKLKVTAACSPHCTYSCGHELKGIFFPRATWSWTKHKLTRLHPIPSHPIRT